MKFLFWIFFFWIHLTVFLIASEVNASSKSKAIQIDQLVSQDSNLGNFNRVINIPLPTKLPGIRNTLGLVYNSYELNHFSMGYGFNWNLPEIRRDHSKKIFLKDRFGIVELVKNEGVFYEVELSRFVRLEKKDKEFKAIYADGSQKLFDDDGRIIEEISAFLANSIKYQWEGSRLKSISISSGDQVNFHYKECSKKNTLLKNQDLPFYKFGRWYQAPQCLSSITYSSDSRALRFKYNDYLNLSAVFWEGEEDFKLFSASYSRKFSNGEIKKRTEHTAPSTVIGTPSKESISLSLGGDHYVFKNVLDFYEEQGMEKISGLSFLDFNNDGITDYLVTSRNVRAFLGVGELSEIFPERNQARIKFKRAPDFDLPLVFKGLQFLKGDFNGDGRQDIIGCGEKSYLALNQKSFFQVSPLNITCSKESMIYDINYDGFSDVMNQESIYLSSLDGFKEVFSTSSDLKKLQASLGDIQWGVRDLNSDLVPEAIDESDLLFTTDLGRDKNYEFWRPGSRKYFIEKKLPAVPLISSITLPFGGRVKVQYDVHHSLSVVKEIIMDPLIGVALTYIYNYHFPFFDPLSDHFLGFEVIERLRASNETMEGSREVLKYLNDKQDLRGEIRKRYHGLLRRVIRCSIKNCQRVPYQLARTSSVIDAEWERMQEIQHSFIPVSKLGDYKEKSPKQYFKYLERVDRYLLEEKVHPNSVRRNTGSEHTINSFYNFSELGPLSAVFTSRGHGLEGHLSDYEYADFYESVHSEKIIYQGIILPKLEKTIGIDKDYKKVLTKHRRWEYSKEVRKKDFTIKEIMLGKDNKELKSHVKTFTAFGGMYDQQFSSGKTIYRKYDQRGNTTHRRDESSSVFSMNYDSFGNLLKRQKFNKTDLLKTTTWDVSSAGYLKELTTNQNITKVTYDRMDSVGVKETKKTYSRKNKSPQDPQKPLTVEITYFDGMGNKIQSFIRNQDGDFRATGLTFWTADGRKAWGHYPTLTKNAELDVNKAPEVKFHYNSLGDLLSHKDDRIHKRNAFEYNGKYIIHKLNNILVNRRGYTYSGIPLSYQKKDKEIISINLTPQNDVLRLGEFEYELDLTGNIKGVYNAKLGKGMGWQKFSDSYTQIERAFEKIDLDENEKVLGIFLKEKKEKGMIDFKYNGLNHLELYEIEKENFRIQISYNKEEQVEFKEFEVVNKHWENSFEYDDLNRLKSKALSTYQDPVTLNYQYNGLYLESIRPFIEKVERDHLGHITSIEYQNGLMVQLSHTPNGLLKTTQVGDFSETVHRNGLDQIKQVYHNYSLDLKRKRLPHLEGDFEYSHFEINEKPRITDFKRGDFGHLKHSDLVFYNPYLNRLKSLEGKKVIYRDTDSILAVGDEYYISSNFHFIDGYRIEYLRLGKKIVGAFITGKDIHGFYPIVSDFRNSVRQIYNSKGEILVLRNYSTWGELETERSSTQEAQLVDRLIRYDFALLIRPYQSKFLVSKTRVYSPEIGEWATVDTTLLWYPKMFLDRHLDEVNGFSYAGNDPLNYIDPSGRFLVSLGIAMLVGGVIGSVLHGVHHGFKMNVLLKGFAMGAISSAAGFAGVSVGIGLLGGTLVGAVGGGALGGAVGGALGNYLAPGVVYGHWEPSWGSIALGAFAGAISGGSSGLIYHASSFSRGADSTIARGLIDAKAATQSSLLKTPIPPQPVPSPPPPVSLSPPIPDTPLKAIIHTIEKKTGKVIETIIDEPIIINP